MAMRLVMWVCCILFGGTLKNVTYRDYIGWFSHNFGYLLLISLDMFTPLQGLFGIKRKKLTWQCKHILTRNPVESPNGYCYVSALALASLLFRTSGITNHWKNTAIRDFASIWHVCIFFLVTLLACWSSSCWLDFSTLLFNCPYCRKLDF